MGGNHDEVVTVHGQCSAGSCAVEDPLREQCKDSMDLTEPRTPDPTISANESHPVAAPCGFRPHLERRRVLDTCRDSET